MGTRRWFETPQKGFLAGLASRALLGPSMTERSCPTPHPYPMGPKALCPWGTPSCTPSLTNPTTTPGCGDRKRLKLGQQRGEILALFHTLLTPDEGGQGHQAQTSGALSSSDPTLR